MATAPVPDPRDLARAYLSGQEFSIGEVVAMAKGCRIANDFTSTRQVLARLRTIPDSVIGTLDTRQAQDRLITDEALSISKDPELAAAVRHDQALQLLRQHFANLDAPELDALQELMGVAGGICKRRWNDLGQLANLRRAADFYGRGARGQLGDDAYCQINAAFLDDVLAAAGDDPGQRLAHARAVRERIVTELAALDDVPEYSAWWNAASRAEALFGLGRVAEATAALRPVADRRPEEWQLETTVRQLAHLARLQHTAPWSDPLVLAFFDALIPGDASVVLRAVTGRVGLALSGGGFRAAFYHLGVLARLAELDALRHVSVLSCVSGGSVVGACYWLMLRQRLVQRAMSRDDYITLVKDLITHFEKAVATNLIDQVTPNVAAAIWRSLKEDQRGAIPSEDVARALELNFYRPLASCEASRGYFLTS